MLAVTRGALNTPEAVREAAQGKSWDAEKREWVETPSDAVAVDDPVYADARARYQKTRAESNGKTFPYYYEVLGVSVCTSTDQQCLCRAALFPEDSFGPQASQYQKQHPVL
jgi:hypothetical protein